MSRMLTSRMRARIGAVAVAVLLLSSCGWIGETFLTNRTPCDYYLPEGFHGWAEISFETAGAPPQPLTEFDHL
jgi:hypothetical protein